MNRRLKKQIQILIVHMDFMSTVGPSLGQIQIPSSISQ